MQTTCGGRYLVTEQKPSRSEKRTVRITSAASQAPDTSASNPEQPPAPEPEATDPTTPRVDPAVLAQRCAEARERIGFYERTPAVRILFENDNGQTVRMTPAQRSSRLKQYREIASQSCR